MDSTPDPDNIRTTEELRSSLVRLAGSRRKVRTIARDVRMSPSSVSELLAGKRGITRRALVAFVDAYAPADHDRWVDAWSRAVGEAVGPMPPTPRQLPADQLTFVGREAELDKLDEILQPPDHSPDMSAVSSPPVLALVGTAGVGKTALAVHWGHRRQDRFPDGSLYLDLRGYDPAEPLSPGAALAGLLRSLGLKDADQPLDLEERAARYRSLLAERRVLVLLDNVRDSEQVRLLLPGTSASVTVITTRDALGGLRYRQDILRLDVGLLSASTSAQLLAELAHGGAEPDMRALTSVVQHCSGLPLALRIAAGLATDQPGGLAVVAAQLAEDRHRLDLLDSGDPRTAVRSVLSWSFRTLDAAVSRTFRLLGTAPAPDADAFLAAALAGITVPEARRHITTLLRAGLLQERRPGRVGMHDLLRDYARDLTDTVEAANEQAASLSRLQNYLLNGTDRAGRQLGSGTGDPRPTGPVPVLPPLNRPDLAMTWFDAEHPTIMTTAVIASREGRRPWVGQVADAAWRLLLAGGHYTEAVQLHEIAVQAAQVQGRPDLEARASEHLGISEQMLGRYDDALRHLERAVELSRAAEDPAGEARALGSLGTVHARLGDHELAIHWLQQGLQVAERTGDELAQARAHNNIGLVYQRWSRYKEALLPLDEAVGAARRLAQTQLLAIALNNRSLVLRRLDRGTQAKDDITQAHRLAEALGDRILIGEVLDSLATLLLEEGDPAAALTPLREALAIHRESGHRAGEAETLDNLGVALQRLGHATEALAHHEESLGIAEAIGDRNRAASALLGSGECHLHLQQHAAAKRRFTSALDLARLLDNKEQEARALDGLARARAALEGPAAFIDLQEQAAQFHDPA